VAAPCSKRRQSAASNEGCCVGHGGLPHFATEVEQLPRTPRTPRLQKQLASERIAALLEDRRIREYEEAAHRAHMDQLVESKEGKLKHAEEQLRQTTKDYIIGVWGGSQAAVRCVRSRGAGVRV